jgi:hypothetical protein
VAEEEEINQEFVSERFGSWKDDASSQSRQVEDEAHGLEELEEMRAREADTDAAGHASARARCRSS